MQGRHVVVDGSNIATEGRSLPSLAQLDQAVREFLVENPDDTVTVVVDASFAHRIDASEVDTFEEAEAANELVSPPAGAIGRGDAFLLRIADKTGATVLSNDSFQEFHGEYDWLFNNGRLIGGKPVPGVGWIFTPRTPVRGPKSREAVKEAKRKRKPEPESSTGLDMAAARGRDQGPRRGKKVAAAIATATEEAVGTDEAKGRRRRKTSEPPAEPVNEPLAFITFIAGHPLGSEVSGLVDSFSSHGAFVVVDGTRCYLPLSAMGEPPPRSAREVLAKGEERTFVVQALDPLRRGVELALPGFAKVAGSPTEETIEAEIIGSEDEGEIAPKPGRSRSRRRPAQPADVPPAEAATGDATAEEAATPRAPRRRKAAASKVASLTGAGGEGPHAAASMEASPARAAASRRGVVEKAGAASVGNGTEAPAKEAAKAPAKRALKAPASKAAAKAPAAKAAAKAPAAKAAAKAPASKAAAKAPASKAAAKAPASKAAKVAKSTAKAPPSKATKAAKAPAGKATKAAKAPASKATKAAKAPPSKATKAAKVSSAAKTGGAPGRQPPTDPAPVPTLAGRRSPRRSAAGEQRGSTGRTS